MIPYQPKPKIPPIGFFEPISVDPKDMMTDVEFLLGILKKINELITQVNSNTAFIDDYNGKIEEIEQEVAQLYSDMDAFKNDVNNNINEQFANIRIELQSLIATALTQANGYTDAKTAVLEEEIREITVGAITVYDPTTGALSPLQTVIDNLYNGSRDEALTATEYDELDLTATAYDEYELTAAEYDTKAKTLLV